MDCSCPNINAGRPNVAGVVPPRPGPAALESNSDPVPPSVDVKGVTKVNMDAEGLESAVPFAVVEGNVGLFIVGAGVDRAVAVVMSNR